MTFNLFNFPWCKYLPILYIFPSCLNTSSENSLSEKRLGRNYLDFLLLRGMNVFYLKTCKVQLDLCKIPGCWRLMAKQLVAFFSLLSPNRPTLPIISEIHCCNAHTLINCVCPSACSNYLSAIVLLVRVIYALIVFPFSAFCL